MPRGYRNPYRKAQHSQSYRGQPSSTLKARPTPPPSSNPHFLLLEYAHSWVGDTLYVACVSDVPCHQWLRWTSVPMGVHNRVTTLGGYSFMTDPKYCLVQYNEVEQNEAGDTLSHTFNFAGWATCEWRWWYLVATLGGEPSPSATCIFQAHYLDQEEAESLKHTDLIEKEVAAVIDHADNSITADKLEHDLNGVPIGLNADKLDGLHASEIAVSAWDAPICSYPCDTVDGWSIFFDAAPSNVQANLEGIKCSLRNVIGANLYLRRSFGGLGRINFNERVRALFLVKPWTSIEDVLWYLFIGGQTGAERRVGFRIQDGVVRGAWRGATGLHFTGNNVLVAAGEIILLEFDHVADTLINFYVNGAFLDVAHADLPTGNGVYTHFISGLQGSVACTKNLYLLHMRTILENWPSG